MERLERLVSCIVPIYNGEKWLKKCIKSLTSQSYRNIEILLINDGSVDRSEKICLQMQKKDSRIRYYVHTNQGVSYTRNRGITLSQGEYLCFVDCDDVMDRDGIKTLVDTMESSHSQMSVGAIKVVTKYKPFFIEFEPCMLKLNVPGDKLLRFVFDMRSPSGYMAAKLYESRIIKENQLTFDLDIRCFEDAIFTYNYLQHCACCAVTDKVVYYYNCMNEKAATKMPLAFRHQRYVWETQKLRVQMELCRDIVNTEENREYVKYIVLRHFWSMCEYYVNLSPDPVGDVGRLKSYYLPLLKEVGYATDMDDGQFVLANMQAKDIVATLREKLAVKDRKSQLRRVLRRILRL